MKQLVPLDFGGLATVKSILAPSAAGDAARVDPPIKVVSTTTYTLLAADIGSLLVFTNVAGCTVTAPNNLVVGWNATLLQAAAGAVVFSPASGASALQRQSFDQSAGEGAGFSALVVTNSGATAQYWLQGDMAA